MQWDATRVTTTDEQFLGRTVVNVFYDGLYIGLASHEGDHWEDAHQRHCRTREQAVQALSDACECFGSRQGVLRLTVPSKKETERGQFHVHNIR